MANHLTTGRIGEDAAASYLLSKKYSIIARNYKLGRIGEIDIIAEKRSSPLPFSRKMTVFVEVKSLSGDVDSSPFLPEHHIDEKKIRKLVILGRLYMSKIASNHSGSWRIDVIAVNINSFTGNISGIRHYENAISDFT